VFDFETGGINPYECEITQIGALVLDPATLELVEGAAFNSEVRPLRPELLQQGALDKTRKTREALAEAPMPGEVWARFTAWCRQFCVDGKATDMKLPFACGHNILKFDLIIARRYCEMYGPMKPQKDGTSYPTLFCPRYEYDTLQLMNYWTEGLTEPDKLSLDALRKYFGMPKASLENGHDAFQDVKDTAVIIQKLLRLGRKVAPRTVFKDCCDEQKVKAELERRKERQSRRK
jgi:DNA polymerase III epsilon subunit-like protein